MAQQHGMTFSYEGLADGGHLKELAFEIPASLEKIQEFLLALKLLPKIIQLTLADYYLTEAIYDDGHRLNDLWAYLQNSGEVE